MKSNEIKVGGRYIAKVSNKLTTVVVQDIEKVEGVSYTTRDFLGSTSRVVRRSGWRYYCENVRTGRIVVFRSAAKFRRESC